MVQDGQVSGVIDLTSYDLKHEVAVETLDPRPFIVLDEEMSIAEAIQELKDSHSGIAVISASGSLEPESVKGVVTSMQLIKVIGETTRLLRM